MRDWDFGVTIETTNVQFNITGNKNDSNISNQCMFNFGIANHRVLLQKKLRTLSINASGITMETYFSFIEIYRFVMKFAESSKIHMHNLKIQTSMDQYSKWIKQAIERQENAGIQDANEIQHLI